MPIVTKDLVFLEERVVLPTISNPGVTVGRPAESVLRLAVFPKSSYRPTALRFHFCLGRLVIICHPLECRLKEWWSTNALSAFVHHDYEFRSLDISMF